MKNVLVKPESLFKSRGSITEIEEGTALAPAFDSNGLVPCVVSDQKTGLLLMLAYMNAEALALTIQTRQAHYWSRSRGKLWRKGEESGHTQKVIDLRIDCDQDAIWLIVDQKGAACHVGYQSCFYRSVPVERAQQTGFLTLKFIEKIKKFIPTQIYRKP